jgi:Methyltransferase domain
MGITYDNWKTFFFNSNEGQGTLYDRLILHSFFERFIENNKIQTALDCPSFGMTGFSGINSIYLAKKGVRVTIVDDDSERLLWIRKLWERIGMSKEATFIQVDDWSNLPFKDDSFDLVWNLSSLWHLSETEVHGLVGELGRVYKSILFMSVHNTKQLVYPFYKKLDGVFFNKVNEKFCNENYLMNLFSNKLGDNCIREKGYFVTTPWPGLIVKKEDILGGSKLGECQIVEELEPVSVTESMETPEYIKYLKNPSVKTKLNNLMVLENLPNFLKKYWAHLTYYIFQKEK